MALSLNRGLAFSALFAALATMSASFPRSGGGGDGVLELVGEAGALIEPEDLARRIVAGESEAMVLVDMRSRGAFEAYHIPGARLYEGREPGTVPVRMDRTVILYDEGRGSAARTWLALRAEGYRAVYVLHGGMARWDETVLYPRFDPTSADPSELAAQTRLSEFFGGEPRAAIGGATSDTTAPPIRLKFPKNGRVARPVGPGGCGF